MLVPGFLLPFGRRHSLLGPSCARCGVQLSSRSAYRRRRRQRRRRRPAGPQRGCRVAHEQDAIEQGAPFTPRTVVRSRPAAILRPAPAASQRPVPTAPLEHPIGGGHLHEASSGVHSRSPITPTAAGCPREAGKHHAPRRSSPRPPPPDGTAAASASTPGFAPRGHPQSPPRRRRAIAHRPGYYAATSAALHGASHFTHAPSRRTQP